MERKNENIDRTKVSRYTAEEFQDGRVIWLSGATVRFVVGEFHPRDGNKLLYSFPFFFSILLSVPRFLPSSGKGRTHRGRAIPEAARKMRVKEGVRIVGRNERRKEDGSRSTKRKRKRKRKG